MYNKNNFNFRTYVRSLLNERYEGDVDPADLNLGSQEELRNINDTIENKKEGTYNSFVDYLSDNVSDPKIHALLYSGLFDGNLEDDKVQVEEINIPVTQLLPTQKEIGLADSLGWVSKNNPQGGAKLAGAEPGFVADVGGRIITADGKYIIDGHHRWSQVYILNPTAKIPAYNLVAPDSPVPGKSGTKSGQDFLKMAQIAIAAVDGVVPQVQADTATDVYRTKGNRSKIQNIFKSIIPKGSEFAVELQGALSGEGSRSDAPGEAPILERYNRLYRLYEQIEDETFSQQIDNLVGQSREDDIEYDTTIQDTQTVSGATDFGGSVEGYDDVIQYLTNNAIALYNGTQEAAKGMTARSEMPQFDKGGSSPETKINALKTGKIDWNPPYDEGDMPAASREELNERYIRKLILKEIYKYRKL